MPKQEIKVIKIPLNINYNVKKNFERTPNLYLELFENKDKIIQTLVNKPYDPSKFPITNQQSSQPSIQKPIIELDNKLISNSEPNSPEILTHSPLVENEEDGGNIEKEDSIESRLKQLLGEPNTSQSENLNEDSKPAPTLSDLENKGHIKTDPTLPNVDRMPSEADIDDMKRELLFKFELLKKSYKNSNVPEFTIHSDYHTMNKTYEHTVRRLSLDSRVSQYKTYLIGGFMAVEYILGNWLKFDMEGFTQQQLVNMESYERLLIELGEKTYVPEGSDWPVEIRLLFLIIMNAAFFVVSKMLMKKTGSNILGMMNSVNQSRPTQNAPKRKMRGPSINLEDLN